MISGRQRYSLCYSPVGPTVAHTCFVLPFFLGNDWDNEHSAGEGSESTLFKKRCAPICLTDLPPYPTLPPYPAPLTWPASPAGVDRSKILGKPLSGFLQTQVSEGGGRQATCLPARKCGFSP